MYVRTCMYVCTYVHTFIRMYMGVESRGGPRGRHFVSEKNFDIPWKIFPILPFQKKFLDFHPQKFLMTFFSHRPKFFIFHPGFLVSLLFYANCVQSIFKFSPFLLLCHFFKFRVPSGL